MSKPCIFAFRLYPTHLSLFSNFDSQFTASLVKRISSPSAPNMLKQISLLAPFALGALAQNSLFSPTTTSSRPSGSRNNSSNAEASTTMNLFVEYPPGANFAGSIVDANGCDTTIALVCTEGDIYVGGYSIPCDGQETVSSRDSSCNNGQLTTNTMYRILSLTRARQSGHTPSPLRWKPWA